MSRPAASAAFLYWLMIGLAFAVLAPAMIVPAWLEYRGALQTRALRQAQLAQLAERRAMLEKQLRHLQDDEAYVEQVARKELGIETPGVTTIYVQADAPRQRDAEPVYINPYAGDIFPWLSEVLDDLVTRRPHLIRPLLDPHARFVMICASVAMIVCTVLLLGPQRRDEEPAEKQITVVSD
jgi:cell division protein FtsB